MNYFTALEILGSDAPTLHSDIIRKVTKVINNLLEELNPNQRKAVETVEGPLLIVAGPGSGKTRVITHRIAHLINTCGIPPHKIAAVTFTNKAAREIKERLGAILGYSASALTSGTFHSFCAMILRRDGISMGLDRNFAIYDDSEQVDMIKRIMAEIEVDPKKYSPKAIQAKISNAKSQLLDPEGFRLNKTSEYFDEIVLRVYERYEQSMSRSSALDFDDLLMKTYQLLKLFPQIQDIYMNRYLYFMIDEFQDTNIAQYEIAKQLSDVSRNICVVGDPDQSIYSWRNADIRNILSFKQDYPEAVTVALEENYRSSKTIVEAAKNVISANSERVEKELWTNNKTGSPIIAFEGHTEIEEAQFVTKEIANLTHGFTLSEGFRCKPGDIAVMYRVNAQSEALEKELIYSGIGYQIIGGVEFYRRQEIKDLTAYLRLIVNPHDDISLNRVINKPTRGVGKQTMAIVTKSAQDEGTSLYTAIQSLTSDNNIPESQASKLSSRAIKAITNFESLINELRSETQVQNLVEFIELVKEKTGYSKYIRSFTERREEREENIQAYLNRAADFIDLNLTDAITSFLEHISLVNQVDGYDQESELVTLITLHQAKGLEFPVVFMVGMNEGLLPHIRSIDSGDPSEMEEERRLCYVGMTRAEEKLYLLRAFKRRTYGGSYTFSPPSPFLSNIPADLMITPKPESSKTLNYSSVKKKLNHPNGSNIRESKKHLTDSHDIFNDGDKVMHTVFGEGRVISVKPSGIDLELTVAFEEGHGIKRLLSSIAPVKKIR